MLKKQMSKRIRIYAVIAITILVLASNFLFIETTSKENKSCIQEEKIKENLANMKGFFTKNQGQLENDDIYFTYSASDKSFGFYESSVLIKLTKTLEDNATKSSVIKIIFENSNKVIPKGIEELGHKSNYFIGNDSSKWQSNVPNYEKIVYKNMYEGIDLIYYFNEKGLKYDWVVKVDAEPSEIVERFEGIDSLKIDSEGELIIKTEAVELIEDMPYSYQEIYGNIIEVETSFIIIKNNSVSYEVGDYDFSKNLIIDPLVYSTFIGGVEKDYGYDVALDSENNAYITGTTESSDFPTTSGCFDTLFNEESDIFILKLKANGTDLIYSTFLGGNSNDYGAGITLDSENNAYVTGTTKSSDFPTTSGCFDNSYNGWGIYNDDVFVCEINSDGSNLLYSTFVGGDYSEGASGITLDLENNAYITGSTSSSNFPTTHSCFNVSYYGVCKGYIFKLNSNGSDLLYSTFIGGESIDGCSAITLDSENNVYITGNTKSSDFPTTSGCFDESYNGGSDIYVCKLNSNATTLLYSTFVGKGYSRSIVIDSRNNAYITGNTKSTDFPTTSGCFDESHNGDEDIFVFKLNSDGSNLLYSSYVGGNDQDISYSITLDSDNNAYITGYTESSDFPTTSSCYDNSFNGGGGGEDSVVGDVFIIKLNSKGVSMLYSTFVGGRNDLEEGHGILLDSENNIYVIGITASSDFPTTTGAFDESHNGDRDVFIIKLNLSEYKNKKDEGLKVISIIPIVGIITVVGILGFVMYKKRSSEFENPPPFQQTQTCPYCNAKVPIQFKFCNICGRQIKI